MGLVCLKEFLEVLLQSSADLSKNYNKNLNNIQINYQRAFLKVVTSYNFMEVIGKNWVRFRILCHMFYYFILKNNIR